MMPHELKVCLENVDFFKFYCLQILRSYFSEKFNVFMEWACRLTDSQKQWVLDLFKQNMRDL